MGDGITTSLILLKPTPGILVTRLSVPSWLPSLHPFFPVAPCSCITCSLTGPLSSGCFPCSQHRVRCRVRPSPQTYSEEMPGGWGAPVGALTPTLHADPQLPCPPPCPVPGGLYVYFLLKSPGPVRCAPGPPARPPLLCEQAWGGERRGAGQVLSLLVSFPGVAPTPTQRCNWLPHSCALSGRVRNRLWLPRFQAAPAHHPQRQLLHKEGAAVGGAGESLRVLTSPTSPLLRPRPS